MGTCASEEGSCRVTRPYEEVTIDAEVLFEGRIIRVERHTVALEGGERASREIVRHPGAVAIIAEPSPGSLVFVRQYRKAIEGYLLEIPAGKLEPGEDPADCARRELEEETGYRAQSVEPVAACFTSPGFADEKIHLFYAGELEPGDAHPDADEAVDVIRADRAQIEDWLARGELRDAKTLVGVLWWLRRTTRQESGTL